MDCDEATGPARSIPRIMLQGQLVSETPGVIEGASTRVKSCNARLPPVTIFSIEQLVNMKAHCATFALLLASPALVRTRPRSSPNPAPRAKAAVTFPKKIKSAPRRSSRGALKFSARTPQPGGFQAFRAADQLVPHDLKLFDRQEVLRQQRINDHLRVGNQDVSDHPSRRSPGRISVPRSSSIPPTNSPYSV